MGELDQFLLTLPEDKRELARQDWARNEARGVSFRDWANAVRQKYPLQPASPMGTAPADATAVRPNLPLMAGPNSSSVGALDPNAPMVPLDRLKQPGAFSSMMYGGASAVPFADEIAAAALTQSFGGPEYETARRVAEYQMGRAAREHPSATFAGQTVSTVGQILAFPGLSAEQMAAQGPGRMIARQGLEGGLLGGLYASGAADPGNRMMAGAKGFGMGAGFGLGGAVLGEAVGSQMGTRAGRSVRDMAEAGDTPLPAVRALLNEAPAEYPTALADIIGPTGPSRLRSIATTPNAGQSTIRSFFGGRAGARPSRVAQAFEEAAGNTGVNPLARRDALLQVRQQEAEKLFESALRPRGKPVFLPSDKTAPLLRIRKIRELVDEFREIRNATAAPGQTRKAVQTNAPGLERVTAEELHYVKRRLAELGEGAEPGGAAATQAVGRGANSVQGAVTEVLNGVPGYRQANAAYARRSGLMEADEVGRNALQKRPDQVEYDLSKMTPEERQMAFQALPSSVNAALETGSARGALGRLGLGSTPRLGRERILDRFAGMSPNLEQRLDRLVGAEERGMTSEAAALTTQTNSSTVPNLAANAATVAEQGVFPSLRRAAFRSLRDAPNTADLARDAEVLTATGDRLRRLLGEAEQANERRGMVRHGFDLAGRAAAMLTPTVRRTADLADRSEAQDRYWALRAQGVSEDEALKRARGQ